MPAGRALSGRDDRAGVAVLLRLPRLQDVGWKYEVNLSVKAKLTSYFVRGSQGVRLPIRAECVRNVFELTSYNVHI